MQSMLAQRVKTWTEQWKQEGMQLGESKLLQRLLVRRLGPLPAWVEERLQRAGEGDLERWAERLLECASREEVFRVSG
jgi:hypothetical protein